MTHNNDSPADDGDFETLSGELEIVLLAKSEDKSKAFLQMQRAGNGVLAWTWINSTHMAVSGMGISSSTGKVMTPDQSKRHEDVVYDVEKWLDEIRELVAIGQVDFPSRYKIMGLKKIATGKIRDRLALQEKQLHQKGADIDDIWSELRDFALNISKTKSEEERDAVKQKDEDAMETAHVGGSMNLGGGYGYGPSWEESPPGLGKGWGNT